MCVYTTHTLTHTQGVVTALYWANAYDPICVAAPALEAGAAAVATPPLSGRARTPPPALPCRDHHSSSSTSWSCSKLRVKVSSIDMSNNDGGQ